MTRTYEFNNPRDMVELAQFVQTQVYWGHAFIIDESLDTEETVGYNDFWDYAGVANNNGFTKVVIDDKYVSFLR